MNSQELYQELVTLRDLVTGEAGTKLDNILHGLDSPGMRAALDAMPDNKTVQLSRDQRNRMVIERIGDAPVASGQIPEQRNEFSE